MEPIQVKLMEMTRSFLKRHPGRASRNRLADYLLVARPTLLRWAKGLNLPSPRIAWVLVNAIKKRYGGTPEPPLKAKLILHHDDPPCEARLDAGGSCPKCRIHPDMQSTCFHFYCPTCDLPLRKLKCPKCGQTFERPE